MSESQLSQLIGKNPSKPIGDRQARTIEKRLKLPRGYLDQQFPGISPDAIEFARWYQSLSAEQKALVQQLRTTAFKK